MLILIAVRSLLQHRLRTFLLGAAIAFVTALLLTLTGISAGMQDTMLTAATTMMTGHVNVAGFYKVTAGQSAPVVTDYKRVLEHVKKTVPEIDYVAQRGRGWSKLISDTSSVQVGIGGIDITQEPGFKKVIVVQQGNIEDLAKPGSVLLFEEQAKKLGVKVGDQLTFSAPTDRGTNNILDVTVVVIANNIGLLSAWNVFLNDASLRKLYQLNENTTGVLQIYLKDLDAVKPVQERLRKSLAEAGWAVMDEDPTMFWMKFPKVNRENWTGQKLDITNWEDEISFMKWIVSLMSVLSIVVTSILVIIICVGIMNIMWITIRERTREIGTLRAIGMQRGKVLRMFLTEGFLMGVFGTALGAVIGVGVAAALNAAAIPVPVGAQLFLLNDRLVIAPSAGWVIFAMVFITFCITAVSLIPSYLAARMKPITAMHHIG